MYPKNNRIVKASDFDYVIQNGYKYFCPAFAIYFIKDKEEKKIGFIVNNKVGNAVIRNKVKRELRELFREWLEKEEFFKIVIIANKTITKTVKKEWIKWKGDAEKQFSK